MILSHHLWLTDSDLATLNLVQAGLGWAYLPHPLVAAPIDSGNLQVVASIIWPANCTCGWISSGAAADLG